MADTEEFVPALEANDPPPQERETQERETQERETQERETPVPGTPFTGVGDPRNGRGPAPGTGGRTPNKVREACRLAFAERIPLLTAIADGEPLPFQKRYTAKAGKRLPDGSICTKEQEERGVIITARWTESPDIDQRIAAIKELGRFGGMQSQTLLDGEGNGIKPKYTISFE